MRPPTANKKSVWYPTKLGNARYMHGDYNAVDYSASPDPYIYAPEGGTVTFYANSGDCGNNLQYEGASGYRHGFCHLEKSLVKVGQKIIKGQKIGVMGYTGLTIPKGELGRHLHWVLRKGNTYYYPPSKVTEPFKEDDMYKNKSAETHYKEAKAWKARTMELQKQLLVNGKDAATHYKEAKTWKAKALAYQAQNSQADEFNAIGKALVGILAKFGYKK